MARGENRLYPLYCHPCEVPGCAPSAPTAGLILRPAFLLDGRERLEADSTNRRPLRMLS